MEALEVTLVAFALFAIALFLWWLPRQQARSLEDRDLPEGSTRASLENEFRKTLGQMLGPFLVILALAFSVSQFMATKAIEERGEFTERFSQAVQHLSHESMAVRVGGVHALGRLAKDSPEDHWVIMELLTTHLRQSSPRRAGDAQTTRGLPEEEGDDWKNKWKIDPDVQAVITVVCARDLGENNGERILRERGRLLQFHRARLPGGAFFMAELQRARFNGADLRGAFIGSCELDGADFSEAILESASFLSVNLKDADFADAQMSGVALVACNLRNADFSGADLSGAWLVATHRELETWIERNSDIPTSAYFDSYIPEFSFDIPDDQSFMRGADLRGANLSGMNGLTKRRLSGVLIDASTVAPIYPAPKWWGDLLESP